jgi:hypothetical protein
MIVTPFGDLDYGDTSGLQDWMSAHAQRHRIERESIAMLYGIPLGAPLLDAPLNHDFFGRHMLAHLALVKFCQPDTTVSATLLEYEWESADKFYLWHQAHNQIHQNIDNALGIS